MSQATLTPSPTMRSRTFGALAAGILGLALLETGCFLVGAPAAAYMLGLAMGGTLVTVMSLRFLRYWPSGHQLAANCSDGRPFQMPRVIYLMACALIGAAGSLAADALASGLALAFFLFVFGVAFLPWAKIARTRAHCFGYGAAGGLGISGALLSGYAQLNPLMLAAAAWVLWLTTIAAWIQIVVEEKRQQRRVPIKSLARPHLVPAPDDVPQY